MPCEFFVTIPFSSERPIHKINISSHWQRIQRDTACWYLIGYMWQQWHNLCNICDKLSRSIILCFLGDRLMRKYFSDKSEPISFDVFLKLSLMKTLRRRDENIVDCFSQKWTLLTWKQIRDPFRPLKVEIHRSTASFRWPLFKVHNWSTIRRALTTIWLLQIT